MSTRWRTEKPAADEHAAYYASYIQEAPPGDLLNTLEQQGAELTAFYRGIPEAKGGHRYAEGKWTVRDVILHVSDAERVFSYRALRIARNDATDLPGFDENVFVKHGEAETRTLSQLADEFAAVRRATMALLTPMSDEQMLRRGTANKNGITPRALAWIMAGHAHHHARVVKERYLV
jgi:hypothetical protein